MFPLALRTNTSGSGRSTVLMGESQHVLLYNFACCQKIAVRDVVNGQDICVCAGVTSQFDLAANCEQSSRNGVRSREDDSARHAVPGMRLLLNLKCEALRSIPRFGWPK